ncbi:MAG: FAD-dependent oxidoreductase, partial [Bacteroidota bacterium]
RVKQEINTVATEESLRAQGYDEIILATGVAPRIPKIDGIEHPKAVSYMDVLSGKVKVGKRAAIIGAGGIGFDVADFLVHGEKSPSMDVSVFLKEWGVDPSYQVDGGLKEPEPEAPAREVFLLQRSGGKLGARLGKTTGWIHRSNLRQKRVQMIGNIQYHKIDDVGLHVVQKDKPMVLEVDHVVICAGQLSVNELQQGLQNVGVPVHLIGGAKLAAELDAKRAIEEGARLAASL